MNVIVNVSEILALIKPILNVSVMGDELDIVHLRA